MDRKTLLALLLSSDEALNERKDPSNFRYAIYARKSQNREEKQIRSLSDQLQECRDYAERNKCNVVEEIIESESAKEPGIRPRFAELMEKLIHGKLDGIIAWHPDRLARNMKEAGEIIDLLDKEIIKDLSFVSFNFINDTSGKVLLGIAFVLSKQYSDKLKEDVNRGISRSLEEGKFLSRGKHGYTKDRNQRLRPDPIAFPLLREAWRMRLSGETLQTIADYLNNNEYSIKYSIAHERVTHNMKVNFLGPLFRDTLYCGILNYGEEHIDLTEIYDFEPLVSTSAYCKLNNLADLSKPTIKKKGIRANLLRGIVTCNKCKQPMSSGITVKKRGIAEYYYYKCITPGCKTKGVNVRARVVLEFVYDFMEKYWVPEELYPVFLKYSEEHLKEEQKSLGHKVRLAKLAITQAERSIGTTKSLMKSIKDPLAVADLEQDLVVAIKRKKDLKKNLDDIQKKKDKLKDSIIKKRKFLELSSQTPSQIQDLKYMEDLDTIVRKIFSNFFIEDKKVVSYTLLDIYKEVYNPNGKQKFKMVGLAGFEPATNRL